MGFRFELLMNISPWDFTPNNRHHADLIISQEENRPAWPFPPGQPGGSNQGKHRTFFLLAIRALEMSAQTSVQNHSQTESEIIRISAVEVYLTWPAMGTFSQPSECILCWSSAALVRLTVPSSWFSAVLVRLCLFSAVLVRV